MEFVSIQRGRARRKRRHAKRRRREHQRSEVKFKRPRLERGNLGKEKLLFGTMQADSFWKNYTVAQEWQKRHSVTWWKTRCFALEYENQILRDKLRLLASQGTIQAACSTQSKNEYSGGPMQQRQQQQQQQQQQDEEEGVKESDSDAESEDLEFQVDEDMMSFLEQSIRHKIELKKQKEAESMAAEEGSSTEGIQGGAAWVRARNSNAKLLYGDASPTILAMETALQATIDRHKDRAKPQYWPVIPLKP